MFKLDNQETSFDHWGFPNVIDLCENLVDFDKILIKDRL